MTRSSAAVSVAASAFSTGAGQVVAAALSGQLVSLVPALVVSEGGDVVVVVVDGAAAAPPP
jgi:hypothetical protein